MKKPAAKSEQQRTTTERTEIIEVQATSWSGPLPSPQALRDFDEIVDKGAEKIFLVWQRETSHRRKMERRDQRNAVIEAIFGKACALIFALAVLSLCGFAVVQDRSWVAGLIGTGTIASVVWAFVQIHKPVKK